MRHTHARTTAGLITACAALACATQPRPVTTATTTTTSTTTTDSTVTPSSSAGSVGGSMATPGTMPTPTAAGAGASAGFNAATDANAAALVHQANLSEIAAGRLAVQKAQNARVRDFAQRMIADHSQLDTQGVTLAAQVGIVPALPDSTLPRLDQRDMAALQQQSGHDFDLAYVAQQITAHQRTLALIDALLSVAQNPQLRTMLQSARPQVQSHLDMALQIQGQLRS